MTEAVILRLSLRDVGFTWITPCRSFSGRLQTCWPPRYSSAFRRTLNLPWKEGTCDKGEPVLLDWARPPLGEEGRRDAAEGSAPHTCLPSGAIQGLTTSPRLMWKEPDSVFSNIEEVNSVFMALGTKSARMSILERMRWVAEDNHNIDFQQYTCDHPVACPRGATSCLLPALLGRRCPPSAFPGSESKPPESTVTSKAVRSNSTMLAESSWSTPISEMGKYLCSFCRETEAPETRP